MSDVTVFVILAVTFSILCIVGYYYLCYRLCLCGVKAVAEEVNRNNVQQVHVVYVDPQQQQQQQQQHQQPYYGVAPQQQQYQHGSPYQQQQKDAYSSYPPQGQQQQNYGSTQDQQQYGQQAQYAAPQRAYVPQ
ncbi:hypothetical protein BDR26DRAFT_917919 [Obelidium mucronatum]|nr:hypothetical protein BDR26DRAFT_917919 [Obelidium mucronatum]